MAPTSYQRPTLLFNRHLETIYPSLLRQVVLPAYQRERITTPDNDFLDLDWLKTPGAQRLVLISHGLEGNSGRPYVKGMARTFFQAGYDVLAWNYRGCSEEMNRQLRFYHSGATDDLDTVLTHALQQGYQSVFLVGFSLGGNLTLKYLGERGTAAPPRLQGAVAISVPLDLHGSCLEISRPANWLYAQRFLKSLKKKILDKAQRQPELSTNGLAQIRTLTDFDNQYTSVLHGFRNAIDYYHQCSSIRFIGQITRPVLLINALNDPFLSQRCFPHSTSFVRTEYPNHGGHVGFSVFNQNGIYWSELRALHFIDSLR